MTQFDRMVETLLALGESDRRWLVEQLTPAQRSRLANELAVSETTLASPEGRAGERAHVVLPAAPTQEKEIDSSRSDLTAAAPAQVAELLRREPAWIAHAVLRAQAREWKQSVLAHLSPGTRSEVSRLDQSGALLAPAVEQHLARLAASRLGRAAEGASHSRFDRLLGQLRRRLSRPSRVRRIS